MRFLTAFALFLVVFPYFFAGWAQARPNFLILLTDDQRADTIAGRERKPDRWQPEWIVEKYF